MSSNDHVTKNSRDWNIVLSDVVIMVLCCYIVILFCLLCCHIVLVFSCYHVIVVVLIVLAHVRSSYPHSSLQAVSTERDNCIPSPTKTEAGWSIDVAMGWELQLELPNHVLITIYIYTCIYTHIVDSFRRSQSSAWEHVLVRVLFVGGRCRAFVVRIGVW